MRRRGGAAAGASRQKKFVANPAAVLEQTSSSTVLNAQHPEPCVDRGSRRCALLHSASPGVGAGPGQTSSEKRFLVSFCRHRAQPASVQPPCLCHAPRVTTAMQPPEAAQVDLGKAQVIDRVPKVIKELKFGVLYEPFFPSFPVCVMLICATAQVQRRHRQPGRCRSFRQKAIRPRA